MVNRVGEVENSRGRYVNQCRLYIGNARALLNNGEVEKAGECLWGAMAEAIKAAAAGQGRALRSHVDLRRFAKELALASGDEEIYHGFLDAESLHRNFYEIHFEAADVRHLRDRIESAIERILTLPNS